MYAWIRIPLAALSVILLTAGTADAADLRLVFHGGVHGEIEDCGCKRNPLGGVAQRAGVLQEMAAEDGGEIVLVDAGNLFGKPNAQWRDQTAFLVQETQDLGYAAHGVGPWDLNYGVDFLREQGDRLSFTSANLEVDGELLFPPYRVTEHAGVRIGWISVMDPDSRLRPLEPLTNVSVAPFEAALARHLPELRAKADLVVLLSNLRQGEIITQLRGHAGAWDVDLVIDGNSTYHYKALKEVEGIPVLAANNRGKYLGRLDLTFGADESVDRVYELVSIKPNGPKDPEIASRVEAFLATKAETAATAGTE